MVKELFFLSQKTLKDDFNVDLLSDIILEPVGNIYLYADSKASTNLNLNVILGDLSYFGYENKSTITINDLLKDIDYDNEYTRVSGKKEYLEFIKSQLFDLDKTVRIAFPIINSKGKKWINIYHRPVQKNPQLTYFLLTDFTHVMEHEERNWSKSHRDSLTGLFNKYTLDYHYGLRYQRENFHAIYLDLDNLKQINDLRGHQAGDEALVCFANVLKKYESEYNHFYRLGGDEFVGLFYEDEAVVKKIVESILEDTQMNYRNEYQDTLTVSAGVVQATVRENVIRKADKVLYRVKKDGKNHYLYTVEK